ncbi:MFS transporter [Streptomyces sp. BH106]|uniref:MFS transporter n=1 Tax=Streptomyces sp. BH106 TaxID=3410409 RepID=UPI003CEB7994
MPSPPEKSRALLAILGFAFAAEGALYSAVTPVLPLLSRTLHMSGSQAGLMLSSYSAGIVAGSLLCVLVLRRVNARTGAVGSLALLSFSTLVFAWAQHYEIALVFRLLQGIAGGATWTACVTWLLRGWPLEKRGEALSLSMGPAVVGTIAGPAIGTVAVDIGVQGSYTVVALLCMGAAAWLFRMPRPPMRGDVEKRRPELRGRRRTLALLGAVVLTITGVLLGSMNLVAPLVLVERGAAERTAGVVFVIAAVLTVVAARPFGILVDNRGAIRTVAGGMLLTALAFPFFGASPGTYPTAALQVVLLLANNLCYLSAGTLLSREGERAGWSLNFVTAMTATVWGIGETAGALLAGVSLDQVGALWTSVTGGALAALMLAGVVVVGTRGRAARPSERQARPVSLDTEQS